MDQSEKIYVAGHNGMVGSAIVRKLHEKGFINIISCSSAELDLTNQQNVHNFLQDESPDYVVIAAAKVGGIYACNGIVRSKKSKAWPTLSNERFFDI